MRYFTKQGVSLLAFLVVIGSLIYIQVRLVTTHDYQSALNEAAVASFCGREPVRDYVQKSAAVVKATVFAVTENKNLANVVFTVEKVYAGTVSAPTVAVPAKIGNEGQGSTNDLHFASGQPPYLLFLRKTANGEWRTSRCYGSRMLKGELTDEERSVLEPASS